VLLSVCLTRPLVCDLDEVIEMRHHEAGDEAPVSWDAFDDLDGMVA